MISLISIPPELIRMKIEMHLNYDVIFAFLQHKGYEIKPWLYHYTDETFPNGKTNHETNTWTATKTDEPQSEKSLFLTVFETELKDLLKDF